METHRYRLQNLAWPQVETYLKKSRRIILPVGSTEQHGVSGILGIDYLSSEAIAQEVALRLKTLVAPVLPFGMAVHHMAFPGTITLTPSTYVRVVSELIQALMKHGFEEFFVINGHGGNTAPITTAFCETKQERERTKLKLLNWWTLPEVVEYEKAAFGDKSGFHATCGEISVTMKTHPEAYAAVPPVSRFDETPTRTHWPMSPVEYRETFVQGHMGSDPSLATAAHGEKIFEIAVQSICRTLSES